MSALHVIESQVNPDAVELLESLLARARSGEVVAFAAVSVQRERGHGFHYATGDAADADVYFAIERMKLDLLTGGGL